MEPLESQDKLENKDTKEPEEPEVFQENQD